MGVLIDGSVLIAHERGGLDLPQRISGREEEPFFLSVITASELLHGAHRARDRGTRARRSAFVEGVLDALPLLPIDRATARMHAQLWADLGEEGSLIGPHDLWLAASCLMHDLRMVTANAREFRRVAGLEVEDWGAQ